MTVTGRWRPARWLLAILAVAALVGCTGDDDEGRPGPSTSPPRRQAMVVTRADIVSAHRAAAPLDEAAVAVAVGAVQAFYEATVAVPARTGEPGDLFHLVTPDVLEHASGADRQVVFDDELGPLRGGVRGRTEVRLTALAGDDDRPALVIARIDWDVRSSDGQVRIRRTGELSMLPQYGGLRIAAYEVQVERTVGDETTSTTAARGGVGG